MFGTKKLAKSRIASRVTEPLNEIAPRICDLTVQWDEWSYETQSFNSLVRQHIGLKEFSALQFFNLSGTDRHLSDDAPCTLNTPVLRTLKLYVDISNIPQLSIQHLVSLEYERWSMTPPQILDVLTLFPALERCSMIDDDPDGDEEEDNVDRPVVVMHRMQSLSIKFRFVKDVDYLLDHIKTPATAAKVMNLWGPSGEKDGPTLESLIGSRMSSYDELRIVQTPRLLEATLTSKSGGSLQFPHGPRDSDRPLENISFSALASYPSSLFRIELVMPALPSTTRLIAFLRPSPLAHIRIHTNEASFGRLLTALEYTPDVVCPLLESIDCTGTPFSAARMRNFLNFRETQGVALRELKITKSLCDPDSSGFISIIDSLVEVDAEA
ncbi:hypothetical protein SISNIDRAFT_487101 [Sistotremastrum niveocremeum HHB9708]|uniref:F-box domain-containing protein n=1 Tax=Sistotremastrum niveocremeum HHB9708 TaxID=1314777 RepID=A0A164ST73_9AGAM|nr:hypothetical protein SISNIDRAFT_487101 [Sistotremastrum niveocremeum HHB9708]